MIPEQSRNEQQQARRQTQKWAFRYVLSRVPASEAKGKSEAVEIILTCHK